MLIEMRESFVKSGVGVILLLMLVLSPGAASQPAATTEEAVTGKRVYLPADFERYAPQTALDMLQRVPGFSIRQEDSDRGLGIASGNVLVNGQRISGKSNDVITALGRISANSVERIEIMDGATLDIPGLSGQVANVIVRSGGLSGQYGYYPQVREYFSDPRLASFDVSANGKAGAIEYTIGLDNRANRSGAGGPTLIYDSDGTLLEHRDERWRGNSDNPRISGKFAYEGEGGSIGNLNVSYRRYMFDYLETGTRTREGEAERNRRVMIEEEGDIYEVGGDYELGLGTGRLKLIGIYTGNRIPSETDVTVAFADDQPMIGSRFARTGEESERIGRAEYSWKSAGAEWQVSGEAAYNELDSLSHLFVLRTDGNYEEVPLPGASAQVEEDRYELMGSYGRPLGENVALRLSIGAEYSKLDAGSAEGPRSFYRPKGEISTAWKISPRADLNVKLARRVGQLNFYDFLASVNLRDDTETAANPDLVPEQSWNLDIETVRTLGDLGTTTLRLYGQLIDDIIDYVPIGPTGEAPGNIDQATVYGFRSSTTFNLDSVGWPGARLDAFVQLEESEVEDPLTGEKRPISNNVMRNSGLALRHDVPRTDMAWGASAFYTYFEKNYRLTEVGRLWEGPVWVGLYLEHKDVYGLTIRGSIDNIADARSMWDRTVYDGRRTDSVAFVERRDRLIGPIFSLSIRGKF